MSDREKTANWKKILKLLIKGLKAIGRMFRVIRQWFSRNRIWVYNFIRRKAQVGYVRISLSGSFPERTPVPQGFIQSFIPNPLSSGTDEWSLQEHNARIAHIIDADNLRGVIFTLDGLSVSLARLQS
ncbi:MAG: hypothetical protein ACI9EW_002919, partial [Cellvibrionaceae bacterium]